MRLTPADVHNVAFKKPSIGKRGYDEDEVDAFLDIIEAELSRLIEENNELSQRLAGYESGAVPTGSSSASSATAEDSGSTVQQYPEQVPADDVHEHEAPAEPAEQEPAQQEPTRYQQAPYVQQAPAEQSPTAEQPVVQAAVVAPLAAPADHHLQAARLLGLAQETAERLTGEASAEAESTRSSARAEAEKLRTDSHNESEQMLSEARGESERMVSEAKNSSESMITEATAKAEATVRDSQLKAEAIDREAQRKYSEVMNQLTTQRTSLEKKIDDLRTYEREYRGRLKSWITDQLQQLDASAGDGTAGDGTAGDGTAGDAVTTGDAQPGAAAQQWPGSSDAQPDAAETHADPDTSGE